MSRSIRRVVPVLLSAALAALVLAGGPGFARAADGRDALVLAPRGANAVLVANIDHFRRSPLFGDLMGMLENADAVKAKADVLRDAGFDLRKDLSTVVLVGDMTDPTKVAVLLQGRFNASKLMASAVRKGAANKKYRGVAYVELSKGGLVFGPVDDFLVVAPRDGALKGIIDVEQGRGRSVTDDRAMMKLVEQADTKGDVWVVMDVSPSLRKAQAAMGDVETISGSMNAANGMRLRMGLQARSTKAASTLENGFRATKDAASENQTLAPLLGHLRVKKSGRRVDVSLDFSDAQLMALVDQLAPPSKGARSL